MNEPKYICRKNREERVQIHEVIEMKTKQKEHDCYKNAKESGQIHGRCGKSKSICQICGADICVHCRC